MWFRIVTLLCLIALVAGCPKKRHTLVPSVPTNGDAQARDRFLEARARFLRDGGQAGEFNAIATEYAGDPIEPFALLFAGVASQQAGDPNAAVAALDKLLGIENLEAGIRTRGELYLGLSRGMLGDHEKALPLLQRSEAAIENDTEREAWWAALAHAHGASATPLAALPWIDRWWGKATPAERAFLRGRLEQIVAGATPDDAAAAWRTIEGEGPSVGVLGWRVAADRDAAGDADGARQARERSRPVRRAMGLAAGDDDSAAPVKAGVIGAVVPQSAKAARLGEQLVRGLMVGARSLGEAAPTVFIEDGEGNAAADAVGALGQKNVIAILGPTDGASVDAAARRASELGVPLLSFNPRADERPTGGPYIFHMMHSAEARARSLARRATKLGVKRFAVLRPDNGYGTAVTKAFAGEVAASGGEIVVQVAYPPDTKSFAGIVKKLDGSWQAVFVPDQADRLELVAPALAANGFLSRPFGTKKVTGGRPIVLLSTAEGAGEDFVREAARYAEGGLLAPGWFPGALDEAGLEFERVYFETIGKTPTAVDAYAYDAVRLVALLGRGNRGELARKLATAEERGITGLLRFDGAHRRADDGVIYTVEVEDGTASVKPLP
ncbi:MAG TPA: penicillin-binding protein activator [Kofleriaceae bacterium]|nr:penicillin-binding protein activator [Kofleriaceae bacterium]